MAHFVGSQLREMKVLAETIEEILHGPFGNGLTRVALGIREKDGAIPVTPVAFDECCAISLDVLFEAKPGRMSQDNGAGQSVLRDLSPDSNRVCPPVNIIAAQEHNLLSTQCPIMRQQHNDLVAK